MPQGNSAQSTPHDIQILEAAAPRARFRYGSVASAVRLLLAAVRRVGQSTAAGVMQSALLCGASSSEAPLVGDCYGVSLRITDRDVKEAINLSVALNRPERRLGGTMDSSTSSFTD